jgi:hypothetical protein
LKGVLNVSDIIKNNSDPQNRGASYSKYLDLDKIKVRENEQLHMVSDLVILVYVFNDYDKYPIFGENSLIYNNMEIGQSGQYVHYDYDKAFSIQHRQPFTIDQILDVIYSNGDTTSPKASAQKLSIKNNLQTFLVILEEKLSAILERVQDSSFFESVVTESGLHEKPYISKNKMDAINRITTPTEASGLQSHIVTRILELQREVKKLKQ